MLAACGEPATGGPPSPHSTSVSESPSSFGDPVEWRQKGATEVPPASLRDVTLGSVQVVNATNGAVTDSDAKRYATAYVRANAYEFWAWNHGQDGFLLRGSLSDAPTRVFGYDISTIQEARSAHVQLVVTRLTLRRLVLRPVPESLRQFVTSQLFVWQPYAFYLDQVGPSELTWVDAAGKRTTKAHRDAGVGAPELVGGKLLTDPLLGEVWSVDSDFDCTAPNVRQRFGGLCNQ